MSRYQITVTGTADADFDDVLTRDDLLIALWDINPWRALMWERGYGDQLTVRITDTETGQALEFDPVRGWDRVPEGADT